MMCVLVAKLCPTLCDSVNCSLPSSYVHLILQARILDWLANPFSRGSSRPRNWTQVSCIAGKFFTIWANKEATIYAAAAATKSLHSCLTLCDPINCSPLGSTIPGILQEKTLECVAISFSNAGKWKLKSESEVAQLCPTLSNPMDCSLPGRSIHGIFQARVLEWGAIAFSPVYAMAV